MSPNDSVLEIHVHLTNGEVETFVQKDKALAEKLLAQVQPARIFSQEHLTLCGARSISVIHTSVISRIEFLTEKVPDWPCPIEIAGIHEISDLDFRDGTRALAEIPKRPRIETAKPQSALSYAKIGLIGGGSMYLEIETKELTGIDRRKVVQQFFSAPCLPCHRRKGGVTLINPAHITHVTFHPGPPGELPNSWRAEQALEPEKKD